jgi:hypothetical protein
MIRKQISITRRQQLLLQRLAKLRGLSESEVIGQAIEHEVAGSYTQKIDPDAGSLEELIKFALDRRATSGEGKPLQWSREDAYSERLDHYGRLQA